jgi:hypothetical protein
MLNDMNVNTGAQRPLDAFPPGAVDNFLHGEISPFGEFPMKQSRDDPNLVRDFYCCSRSG